jgi:ketosteroid isomerase-like protein
MKVLAGLALTTVLAVSASCAQTRSDGELITLETEWSQAAVKRDGADLQRFYADEYIFTNEDGVISSKTKDIADITSGTFHLTEYKFEDMKVHFYGDVAVVTGRNTIKGRWEDTGSDISGPYRFTDVFVKRDGRWQCVASQSSRIASQEQLK